MMNVRAFEDRTWWDALYDTLGSLGLVLAYEDNNRFVLSPLRSRVEKGRARVQVSSKRTQVARSCAVREIVETQTFDFSDDMINAPALTMEDFNAGASCPFDSAVWRDGEDDACASRSVRRFWQQGAAVISRCWNQYSYTPRENDDKVRLMDGKCCSSRCNPGTAADYATAQNQMRGVYCELNMTKMRAELSFAQVRPSVSTAARHNTGTAPYSAGDKPVIASVHARIVPCFSTVMSYNGTKWVAKRCGGRHPTSDQ